MSALEQIDQTYFTAWEKGDYDTIRSLVAEDVDFIGPLAQTQGIDEFLTGLQGLGRVLTRIEVKADSRTTPTCSPGSTCTARSLAQHPPRSGRTSRTGRSPASALPLTPARCSQPKRVAPRLSERVLREVLIEF